MQISGAVFTTDLNFLQILREKAGPDNLFYFAMDLFSLEKLLVQKKVKKVFIKSSDFNDELKGFFKKFECFYKVFDEFFEIESLLKSSDGQFFSPNLNEEENILCSESQKPKRHFCRQPGKSISAEIDKKTSSESFDKILGISELTKEIRYRIIKAAATDFPVLILGETGTGKTLVANAIHELSRRKNEKILELNINEISSELFESSLFGHEKGAFTGADSFHKGFFEESCSTTLFLDEIGELPKSLQTKLLRVLDKKEFFPVGSNRAKKTDARLIFATSANLSKKIMNGEFRRDLYRRLKNLLIEIPPLRKRKEDIPILAESYMAKNGNGKRLSKNALQFLKSYDWPENIGQLENCLNRAIVFSEGYEINPEDLEF